MTTQCPKCKAENPDTKQFCGDCGTQLTPAKETPVPTQTIEAPKEELTTGFTFAGRYQIIEELGKGGMGKVYKVIDVELKEKVALKLLKPEITADEKTIERFRNELKFARKVSHKNVCRMFDLNKEKGSYYITMEYVSGEDLKSSIRRMGRLTVGKAISIAKQVCEGLAEAHKLGLIHRDLKPQNIMIDRDGNTRIMDFGIARSTKAKGLTDAEVMIGTPEYMSPEQVEAKEIDQRSDIYSLGIMLFEMVTGMVPFAGDTPLSVAVKQKSVAPPNPRDINTQVPDEFSRVILRCLEKSKEKRYLRVEEVFNELEKIEKDLSTTERIKPEKQIEKEEKQSIAVLPFADLSPQKDQEYFCDGMAEELINAFNKVEGLQVASRTSSFQYKGMGHDIHEIVQKLKVGNVLEGSVRKAGNRLRITAQLINVTAGYHVWSEKYDRDMEDVFAIQDEVTLAIVDKLKVKLLGGEKTKILRRYKEDVDAYNLYMKGRYFWNRRTEGDIKKGIDCFEEAIEKDPNYALAYAGLADSYIALPYYSAFPPRESYMKAKEAAMKALDRDNVLAEAYTSLAYSKAFLWGWADAEPDFKRAIELNPSYSIGHHWYSNYLLYLGRFKESLREIKIALELDPLSLIFNRDLGELYYFSRQYDKAIEQFQKTIEIDPDFIYLRLDLGITYLQKGMHQEALVEIMKEPIEVWIGIAYAKMGKEDKARKILDKLKEQAKEKYISPYLMSLLCFSLDLNDEGFSWLRNAYEAHNTWLVYLKVDPLLDSVRSDSKFTGLLKKVGLEK